MGARSICIALLAMALTACGQPHRALYRVPQTNAVIVIERIPDHRFLAEYKRGLALNVNGRKVTEAEMFKDTGGYSRTNVYRITGFSFLIRDASGSFVVDITRQRIDQDDVRRKEGSFIGSFDVDRSSIWRFIPAGERPELPTEFIGG